jgi:hypothetical protein
LFLQDQPRCRLDCQVVSSGSLCPGPVDLHTSTHEAAVCLSSSSPYGGTEADELRKDVNRTATEGSAERNPVCAMHEPRENLSTVQHVPDEVAETENKNGNTGELNSVRQRTMKCFDIVAKHRTQRQGTKSLHECDKTG